MFGKGGRVFTTHFQYESITFSMKARGNEKLTLAPPPFCAQMEGGTFRPLSGVFWSVAITEDFL